MKDRIHLARRFLRRPLIVYVMACLVTIVFVCGRAYEWNRAICSFDAEFQPKWSPPPSKDAKVRPHFFLDNDAYYWISFARQMVETRQWRVRYTHVDNVPYGREVHWSQSVMWLLVGFGYLRHLITGEPVTEAMDGSAIWVNPFLLVMFTILFSWLIARRMGVVAAVFFMLTFVTLPDISWAFHAFRPGHHGLHLAVSFGSALCLVLGGLGWVAKNRLDPTDIGGAKAGLKFFRSLRLVSLDEARRWFAMAGVFTGLGLWVGATIQFFTIGALAIGSMMLVFFMPAHLTSDETDYVPALWRVWGRWASLTGMAFYLIEYFPSHMGLRLEVNNPLYSLAVFCVGELMAQLTRRRLESGHAKLIDYLKIALLTAGVALVPLVFIFGPARWHNMRDVQMARLHNFILEFYTYLNFHPHKPLEEWFFRGYGILPFFLLGALALSGPRRTRLYEWAVLWISFFLSLFSLFLTLWQVRWGELHAAMSVWLMIVVGHITWRNVLSAPAHKRSFGFVVAFSVLVLLQAAYFAWPEFSNLDNICQGRAAPKEFVDALMKKHLAVGLRAESRGEPLRVICEADLAPALYYFGGIQSVASLYWENVDGLHDATAFFTDHGDTTAKRIAKERGLTHVLVSGGGNTSAQFNYIATGDMTISGARSTLLARLEPNRYDIPSWITVDQNLTAIGMREFRLRQAGGVGTLRSLVAVYRLEPTSAEGHDLSQEGTSRP
jgi:hypothetical protein